MHRPKIYSTVISLGISFCTLAYFVLNASYYYPAGIGSFGIISLFDSSVAIAVLLAILSLLLSFRTMKPKLAYKSLFGYLLLLDFALCYYHSGIHRIVLWGFFPGIYNISLPNLQVLLSFGIPFLLIGFILLLVFRTLILKLLARIMNPVGNTTKQAVPQQADHYQHYDQGYQPVRPDISQHDQVPISDDTTPQAMYPYMPEQQQQR